jgi:hypothetical protein
LRGRHPGVGPLHLRARPCHGGAEVVALQLREDLTGIHARAFLHQQRGQPPLDLGRHHCAPPRHDVARGRQYRGAGRADRLLRSGHRLDLDGAAAPGDHQHDPDPEHDGEQANQVPAPPPGG